MLSKKRSVCGMSALEKPSFFKQLSTAKRPVLNNALELIFVQQQLVYNALVLVVEYRTNIKLVPFFGTIASLMPFPNDRASTIDEPSRKKNHCGGLVLPNTPSRNQKNRVVFLDFAHPPVEQAPNPPFRRAALYNWFYGFRITTVVNTVWSPTDLPTFW